MLGGWDDVDAGWVRGVDIDDLPVGNGWDDGEEGRRGKLTGERFGLKGQSSV